MSLVYYHITAHRHYPSDEDGQRAKFCFATWLSIFVIINGIFSRYDVLKDPVKKVPHDVLILWGEQDRALTTHCIDVEKSLIAGSVTVFRYPEGNHNLFHSHEKECLERIGSFLAKRVENCS